MCSDSLSPPVCGLGDGEAAFEQVAVFVFGHGVRLGQVLLPKPKLDDNMAKAAHPHTVYCEASGGIGFDRLKRVAQTGVDGIVLGYLTHSSRSLDIGLDFVA